MPRSLSFDSLLAALAVLSVDLATSGCSKRIEPEGAPANAPAQAAPPPVASAAAAPAEAAATTTAAAEPSAATPKPTVMGSDAVVVDAGVERSRTAPPGRASSPKSHAACGAQGCSPDMKKLGK